MFQAVKKTENPTEEAPKAGGAASKLPPTVEKSTIAEDKFTTDYDKEKHAKLAKYHEHAMKTVFELDPSLKSVYHRDKLVFMVTPDVQRQAAALGKMVPPETDGITLTVALAKGGDPNKAEAKATFVILDDGVYRNYSKLVTTLLHELRHCQQSINPPAGQKLTLMSERAAELDAYTKGIADIKKLRGQWAEQAKTDPKKVEFVKQMDEVIAHEEKLLASYQKK